MPSPLAAGSGAPMLLQVILPDNRTILSTALASLFPIAKEDRYGGAGSNYTVQESDLKFRDLIQGLLRDSTHAAQLQTVFGHYYHSDAHLPSSAAQGASASHTPRKVTNNLILQGSSRDATHWFIDSVGTRWGLQAVVMAESNKEWAPGEIERIGDGEWSD